MPRRELARMIREQVEGAGTRGLQVVPVTVATLSPLTVTVQGASSIPAKFVYGQSGVVGDRMLALWWPGKVGPLVFKTATTPLTWTNVTPSSGLVVGSGTDSPLSYTVYADGSCELSGLVKPSSGNFAASSTITLAPAGSFPKYRGGSYNYAGEAMGGAGVSIRVQVQTDGSLIAVTSSTQTPAYIVLTGLRYSTI